MFRKTILDRCPAQVELFQIYLGLISFSQFDAFPPVIQSQSCAQGVCNVVYISAPGVRGPNVIGCVRMVPELVGGRVTLPNIRDQKFSCPLSPQIQIWSSHAPLPPPLHFPQGSVLSFCAASPDKSHFPQGLMLSFCAASPDKASSRKRPALSGSLPGQLSEKSENSRTEHLPEMHTVELTHGVP